MARTTRQNSRGNFSVDYTALRADIQDINPVIKATLRNAVPVNGQTPSPDENQGTTTVNPFKLQRLSNIISNNINAATDLRQITPYIDKAELIWSTILLYPNGKQDKTLTYDTKASKFKNAKLHDELLRIWDNYYTNDYKIEPELRKIVNDVLWNTGSYTLFNLSRPGLDYLINGSEMESVAGQESLELQKQKARAAIDKEFVSVNGKVLARNLGMFVRDPNADDKQRVSGLESIFNQTSTYSGTEFNLFGGDEFEGAEFPITITDNPALLYSQRINEMHRQSDVDKVMGAENLSLVINHSMQKKKKGKRPEPPKATTQNLTEAEAAAISTSLFPQRNVVSQSIQFVKSNDSLKGASYGRGLTFHVPSEAVMTIHRQGSNGQKQDFIFLVDDDGNFLKNTADIDYYQSTKSTKGSIANGASAGSTNSLISNLKTIQDGKECDFDMSEFVEMSKSIIIRQFMSAILSGKGDNISVSIDEETNKIFLARLFKRQGVRCLYVPGESVTYIALKHNSMGTGQSLTQTAKMHIARLAAFDVADAMANLEAAQSRTQMDINIGKEDPDPANTISIARATFFESNPRLHGILGSINLSIPQIVDAMRESSLTVKINAGDNPHMPAPDISLTPLDKQVFKPVDQGSRDEVLNKISNYFFLPRSWLDVVDGGENNFQIEALVEHQMLLNQGANWQDELCEFFADFQRKHAAVNAPLLNELVEAIVANETLWKPDSDNTFPQGAKEEDKIKLILNDFFNNLYCRLPTPNSTESTNKLKEKLDAVQALVDAWDTISGYETALEPVAKALGLDTEQYSADQIKAALRSVFYTEAFRRYNIPMPFDDIVSEGKGGGMASLINAVAYQRTNVGEFLAQYIIEVAGSDKKMIKDHQKKIAKALTALEEIKPETEEQEPELDENGEPVDGGDGETGGEDGSESDTGLDDGEDTSAEDGGEEGDEENSGEEEENGGDSQGLNPAQNDPNEDPFTP